MYISNLKFQVIEILIRIEDGLARDVRKHLQNIEEQILERYAWMGNSPLWQSLELVDVPSCETVGLPQTQTINAGTWLMLTLRDNIRDIHLLDRRSMVSMTI